MPQPKVININNDVVSRWAGVPKTYSRAEVASAIQNFSKSIPIDASNKNINKVLDYLDSRGHNQGNLDQAVSELYHPNLPSNNTRSYWDDIKSNFEKTGESISSGIQQQWEGLKEAGKQALMMLDTPRRIIANTVQREVLGNNDPAYSWKNIPDLDYAWNNPSPIIGKEEALKHPVISFGVDLLSPTLAAGAISKGVGLVRNAASYAGRGAVTGLEKDLVLKGKDIPGRGYEISSEVVPDTQRSSSSYFNSFSGSGGKTLTGTSNGATGKPYSQGSSVNSWITRGAYNVVPTKKLVQNVTGWNMVNPTYTWAGLPQSTPVVNVPSLPQPVSTIVTQSPFSMTDSEIIRRSGAKEGDIVVMPDGRRIKYIKGNGGLGKSNDYQVGKEYDRSMTNVRLQPNVPAKTYIKPGIVVPSVKIIDDRNPSSMRRNYNDFYPKLIK